jgi:hypothetical protein
VRRSRLAAKLGRLVAGLVERMTVYGTDEATSDYDCDADERGPGSSTCDDPLTKEKLEALRLKRVNAYVRVDEAVSEVSYATNKKREQRKKQSDNGRGDYIVSVNKKDKEARRAIKAVANAILVNQNAASAVTSFISDARLFELVEILLASKENVSLITDMARRGDLTALATINTNFPKLLQAVLTLAQSDDESAAALDGIFRNVSEASSGAEEVLNAAVAASQHPGDVMRYLEVNRRGGVRAQVLRWILRGAT